MNRRDFLTAASIGVVAASTTAQSSDTMPDTMNQEIGPYYIEIYAGNNNVERSLPIFDTLKQATNLARARITFIKKDYEGGQILVRGKTNAVAANLTWGTNWLTETVYTDYDERVL